MRRYVPLFAALHGIGDPAERERAAGGRDAPQGTDFVELSADGVEWFAVGPGADGDASNDDRADCRRDCPDSRYALLRVNDEPLLRRGHAAAAAATAPGALVLMVGGVLATGSLRVRRPAQP